MNPAGFDQFVSFFFRPQGRITRTEYFLGIALLLAIDLAVISFLIVRDELASGLLIVTIIVGLPLTVAQLVLVTKRCHDLGLPGTFLLLLFVPIFGLVWLVLLALMPGNKGPNAYGPVPGGRPD